MIELMSLKQFKVNKTDYYLPRDMEKLQYGHLVLMDNPTPEDNIKYLIMNDGIKKRDAYNCVYADNKIQFTAYSLVRANMTKERLALLNKYKEAAELKTVLTTSMLKGRNTYYDISVWNKMYFEKASRMGYIKKLESYYEMIRQRIREFDSKLWTTRIIFIDARSWQASLSSNDEHIRYDNPITLLYMGMKKDFGYFKSIGDVEFVIAGDSGMFRMNPSECDEKSFNDFKKAFKRIYSGKTSDMDEEAGDPENVADSPVPDNSEKEPDAVDPKADAAKDLLAKKDLNNSDIGNSDIATYDDPHSLDDPKVKELIKQSKILEPVDIKSTAMSKRDAELREAQKNLKLANGKTLNDLLMIQGDKVEVPVHDVSHKIKTANAHMAKVHFDNMAKTYNSHLYEKDLMSIAASMQNKSIPVYIRDVKKENTSDSLNLKETLTFSLEDSERRRHTLKFDVPKFIDNRFMYLNGHKKEFNNQRFLKPIVKTGPDTVQICTNYNKIFMTRYGENVEAKFEKFKNFVLSDKKRFKARRGDCSALNKDYKTTIEYDTLAKTFASIEVINNKKVVCTLIFNQPKLKEYFEKSKFKKLYDGAIARGELVVGYTGKGLPLTFSDDTYQFAAAEAMSIDMASPDWLTESVNGCLREGMYPASPADTNVNDRMDSVRNELESLINGEGDMSPEEREARISELKHQRQMLMSNRLVTEKLSYPIDPRVHSAALDEVFEGTDGDPEKLMKWMQTNNIHWPAKGADGHEIVFKKNFSWPDDILRTHESNCLDNAYFVRQWAKYFNYPSKIAVCSRYYIDRDNPFAKAYGHFKVLVKVNGKWIDFRYQNRPKFNKITPVSHNDIDYYFKEASEFARKKMLKQGTEMIFIISPMTEDELARLDMVCGQRLRQDKYLAYKDGYHIRSHYIAFYKTIGKPLKIWQMVPEEWFEDIKGSNSDFIGKVTEAYEYEPVEEFFFDKKKEAPKRPANLPAESVLESEYKKAQSAVKSAMSKASPRLKRCITFADTSDPSYKKYLNHGEWAVVATVVASKGYGHIEDGDDKVDEYQDDYDAFFELCGDKYDHRNFQISDSGDWDDKDIILEWFDSTKESYNPVMEADAEPLEDTTKEPVGIVDYVLAIFAESLDLGEFAKYKSGKKFMYTRCTVMKKHIPLVIFLAYCEGITTVLRKAGVTFQFSDKRIRLEGLDAVNKGIIPFQDGYLIYDKYPLHISLLMNGLSVIDTKSMDYAELDSKSIYLDIFDRLYGARMLANALDNFYEWMIDAPTIEILNDLNYPTDLVGLMLAGNKLLADNNFSDEIDMKNWRIRNNELVYAYAYKRVADAYARYRMTSSNKNPVKISIPQDAVIKDIMTSQIVEDVSELSPIVEIEKGHTLTDKGPSGTNLDESYTMERRCFHPSMKGVVAMSSSPDYNVGKTRELTMEPNVVNARGYIIPPDKGDLNDVNLFSAAELLTPMGATKDDTIRTAMGSKQSKHIIPIEDATPVLMSNGAEKVLPYHLSSDFSVVAEDDGEVVEVNEKNEIAVLKYKSGKIKAINMGTKVVKNGAGGFFLTSKLDCSKLKKGKKFKKDDILAYNTRFFSDNSKDGTRFNIGTLVKVACMSSYADFEDATQVTTKLSRKLGTEICMPAEAIVGKNSNVDYIAKVGQAVNVGDPLIIYDQSSTDASFNKMLANIGSDLKEQITGMGKTPVKSHYTGVVQDIKIYATVDLDDMSPSLKKIVGSYYAGIKAKKAVVGKYRSENGTEDYLFTEQDAKIETDDGKVMGVTVGDGVLFVFYVKYRDNLDIGDKIVNFAALKAVTGEIIPEGLEPFALSRPDEEISTTFAPLSVLKRMVPSILLTMFGNKVLVELKRNWLEQYQKDNPGFKPKDELY